LHTSDAISHRIASRTSPGSAAAGVVWENAPRTSRPPVSVPSFDVASCDIASATCCSAGPLIGPPIGSPAYPASCNPIGFDCSMNATCRHVDAPRLPVLS
jgi:hypothetical protein